jgi:hypothetical protein
MTRKSAAKPKSKLTDAERHARFVAMARELGASEDEKDFEKAFRKVTARKGANSQASKGRNK